MQIARNPKDFSDKLGKIVKRGKKRAGARGWFIKAIARSSILPLFSNEAAGCRIYYSDFINRADMRRVRTLASDLCNEPDRQIGRMLQKLKWIVIEQKCRIFLRGKWFAMMRFIALVHVESTLDIQAPTRPIVWRDVEKKVLSRESRALENFLEMRHWAAHYKKKMPFLKKFSKIFSLFNFIYFNKNGSPHLMDDPLNFLFFSEIFFSANGAIGKIFFILASDDDRARRENFHVIRFRLRMLRGTWKREKSIGVSSRFSMRFLQLWAIFFACTIVLIASSNRFASACGISTYDYRSTTAARLFGDRYRFVCWPWRPACVREASRAAILLAMMRARRGSRKFSAQ
jgi:hypothetical protein